MLAIGAPVCQRGWILAEWFEHLANQEDCPASGMTVYLNYGDSTDATLDIIDRERARGRFKDIVVLHDTVPDHFGGRVWNMQRYATMTRLRNDLLNVVREVHPDFYLSCDTDMLLPAHTLRTLFQEMNGFDGVAPLTFMTETGTQFPNAFAVDGSRQLIPETTTHVYACFGTILMNERLYSGVDYAPHEMGEDLGWARNVWATGLRLALTPCVRVKHVMRPEMLGVLDERVGF